MRKAMLLGLMLAVTATIYSCGNNPQPTAESQKPKGDLDNVNVVIVSPSTGKVSQMSGTDMKAMLDDWKATSTANVQKGKRYYDESQTTVYWVKHKGTGARFAHYPDKWIGINYHAYAFKGVVKDSMVYTTCEKDSVGEICFRLADVTTNVTETWSWHHNITDTFSTLTEGIALGCSMEQNDVVFKNKVLPAILSDMKSLKLPVLAKMNQKQIAFVLRRYTEKKNPKDSPVQG